MAIILPDITPGEDTTSTNDPVDSTPTGYSIRGVDINKYLQTPDGNMPEKELTGAYKKNGDQIIFVDSNSIYTNGLTPPPDQDPITELTYMLEGKSIFDRKSTNPLQTSFSLQRRGYNPLLKIRIRIPDSLEYTLRWEYLGWCSNHHFDYGTLKIYNNDTQALLSTYSPVPPLVLGLLQGSGGGGSTPQGSYTYGWGGAGGAAVPLVLNFPRINHGDATGREVTLYLGRGGAGGKTGTWNGSQGEESWIGISARYKDIRVPGGIGGNQDGGGTPVSAVWNENSLFVRKVAYQNNDYISFVSGGRGGFVGSVAEMPAEGVSADLYMANSSNTSYKVLSRTKSGGGVRGGGASFLDDGAYREQPGFEGAGGGAGKNNNSGGKGGDAVLLLYW